MTLNLKWPLFFVYSHCPHENEHASMLFIFLFLFCTSSTLTETQILYLIKLIVDTDHRLFTKMKLIFRWCNYGFVCLSSCSIKMRKHNFKLIWWLELFPRFKYTRLCANERSINRNLLSIENEMVLIFFFLYGEWINWMKNDDRI